MPSRFFDIEKSCLTCNKKLIIKSKRDIDRKNYCSRNCLGKAV